MTVLILPSLLIACGMLAFLSSKKPVAGIFFLLATGISGLFLERLEPLSILIVISYLGLFYLAKRHPQRTSVFFTLHFLILAVSVGLFIHAIPGFNNLKILENIQLASDSMAFSMWLNLDKPLIAIGYLWFMQTSSSQNSFSSLKKLGMILLPTVVVLMLLSLSLGYVRFDPKIPNFLDLWIFKVFFLTCFSEECLFRGILWRTFERVLKNPYRILVLTSFLFGLAHLQGGWSYVFLSSIAGLFYGFIYLKTKRIEFSVYLHFLVNLIHLLFFSYPALIR